MNALSLFDGMSGGMEGFKKAGIKVDNYYASEIDEYAIAVSKKNYPEIIQLGDVTKWREWNLDLSSIDIVIGGSPCQSLSITQSKTRQGLDGKSKLFYEYIDILNCVKKYRPDVLFLFENVESMSNECKMVIENELHTELKLQNSNAFVAQDRPRYYGTNFEWTPKTEVCDLSLKDIMEKDVDRKYFYKNNFEYLGDKKVAAILDMNGHDILKRVHSPNFKSHTLTTCRGGNTQKKVLDNGIPRKLTPIEYERLQGFPDNYTSGVCNTERYTMLGNGWTVDVIAHIFSFLPEKYKERKEN